MSITMLVVLSYHATANAVHFPPVVNLGYVRYSGFFDNPTNITRFLGIRIALIPFMPGSLRWSAPQRPSYIQGVQPATDFPPTCMIGSQGLSSVNPFPSNPLSEQVALTPSEDCLFLNVYIPGQLFPRRRKNLPVVVWIHGGGWSVGSASTYNGDDLIKDANGGVIVVTIQYRLGLFGFLPGTEVKKHGALNAGLLDQNFAFQWVQEHITKFGGDPTQVTLWGESAGAGSILQHIVAQDGKSFPPLLKAAIGSSTALASQYYYNDPVAESIYTAVVAATNADIGVLQNANLEVAHSAYFGQYTFVPVVDGSFITRRPTDLLKRGRVNGEKLLVVTNSLEGSIFLDPRIAATIQVSNFVHQLLPELGQHEVDAIVTEYKDLGSPFEQATAIIGEYALYCPTQYLLRPFSGKSYKVLIKRPSNLTILIWWSPIQATFAIAPGEHGDDIPYYFPSRFGLRGNAVYNNTTFRKAFAGSLLNFAISHNPNTKADSSNITPTWETWTAHGNVEMVFNKTMTDTPDIQSRSTSAGLLKRCQFWESIGNP
ncbi:Alpha/Beta hydrolase protein [Collybia nuda]|uniref:Carboxylic ester hydrolase n=1 Tax=Collybia nuda TaxID=64659 RepID=A0A9P5XW21_9AGAR|nr:Alpha/Beta hydrolase protein [Collybia nuda]